MASAHKQLYLDTPQLFLLAVCVADMIFFTYYLFTYEVARQNTISDSLFEHGAYTVVLTVFLAIRLFAVALYLIRYRYENSSWVVAGFIGVLVTFFGW